MKSTWKCITLAHMCYKLTYMTLYNQLYPLKNKVSVNPVFFYNVYPALFMADNSMCKMLLSEYSCSTFTTNAWNAPAQIRPYLA